MVTGPDRETLVRIGRALVEERLAACVNVLPGHMSVYRWEGEVHVDAEALAVVKTTGSAAQSVCQRVAELHPYDLPECVAINVVEGSRRYLEWVRESVGERKPDGEA
jgi:periplasmic divalent cation tolerance protein